MLELLTKQKAKNKQIVIPRIDNCIYEFPLIDSLQPTINRTGVDPIIVGITKTEDGYHFKNSDRIELRDDINLDEGYTTSGWVKVMGDPPYRGHHIMFGGVDFEISISTNEALRIGTIVNGVRYVGDVGVGLISDATWHYLTCVYSPGLGLIGYINGVHVDVIYTPSGHRNLSHVRRIGEYGTDSYGSNALYRGIHVYNVALSPVEVHELYRNSFDIKR